MHYKGWILNQDNMYNYNKIQWFEEILIYVNLVMLIPLIFSVCCSKSLR
ncbi:hypothetical protein VIC_003998 [Vibrio coralliilyticus ATCC BAA-450]|nr:hypothetical protein VIC_003998 [Vibrio coralliilyticus ATCC BAA-450]